VAWSASADSSRSPSTLQDRLSDDDCGGPEPSALRRRLLSATAFVLGALVIVSLPQRPVDVARPAAPVDLPAWLAGEPARPDPLSPREREYFTRFGGSAARVTYGDRALLLVRTSAPLRHLHAPDECLTGAGHEVRHVGLARGRLPAAIYRSRSPDGSVYRVAVTYVSSRGELATNVAEVTWRWLRDPGATWTAYERIAPWDASAVGNDAFDRAVAAAFDLPSPALEPKTPQLTALQMSIPSTHAHKEN
jgi:hypothetical protein